MRTIVLLTISNVLMNLAWYGHLKFKGRRALDATNFLTAETVTGVGPFLAI